MSQTVVLAEKPSVGRDIARVLGARTSGDGCLTGNGYVVTWAIGHLVTLQEPDELDEKYKRWSFDTLPILPERIPLKVIRQTKDQYQKVKALLNAPETDRVICATDAGREGELIFRYIYTMAKCAKPVDRLWISSMTEEAIAEGFRHIRPGSDYDGLYRSARCRSEADWLVGMNASRAFTLRYNALLTVGRVQTPTLALLVRRREEIERFVPESYATLTADFGDYRGLWFSDKCNPDTHLKTAGEARAIAAQVQGRPAAVRSADTQRKQELPPQLYDLTSLQRDANRLLGFTADKTLKIAQSLYEKHKALTYPRTDSRYLPPDMIPKAAETLRLLPEDYQAYVPGTMKDGKLNVSRRTVDASKVSDHHALIPTARRPNLQAMSEDERQLYDLVARRLLQAFHPPYVYDATRVVTVSEGHTFRSDGQAVISPGWRAVPALANPPKSRGKRAEEPQALPVLRPGDQRTVKKTAVKEDQTKPPQPHTDASLLGAMENAGRELDDEELAQQMKGSGIGTPATRAAIIERLIQVGYARRMGKSLHATDKGVQLIHLMPAELTSAEMTGRWELALHKMAAGEQDPERFMEGIRRFSAYLVDYARTCDKTADFDPEEGRGKGRGRRTASKTVKGLTCPLCGKGRVRESDPAFGCTEKGCPFTLWKDCLTRGGGPVLNEKLLTLLLEKKTLQGSTGVIRLTPTQITFTPLNRDTPSVQRDLAYQKAANQKGK